MPLLVDNELEDDELELEDNGLVDGDGELETELESELEDDSIIA